MAWTKWNWLAEFRKLWEPPLADPASHAARIFKAHRNFVLPAKLVILVIVLYYIFFSSWIAQVSDEQAAALDSLQHVTRLSLQEWAVIILLVNFGLTAVLLAIRKFPPRAIYGVVLFNGLVDGLFLLAMTLVTEGFKSYLFWVFPALIVINAFSIPLAAPQIILNLLLSAFYMAGGIWQAEIILTSGTGDAASRPLSQASHKKDGDHTRPALTGKKNLDELIALRSKPHELDVSAEAFMLKLIVLWLLTVCCYGIQVLAARQKQIEEEAREFAVRQGQLSTAGRLAAEIAHQIKNPLAIINNATFSLRRQLARGKTDVSDQLAIIQEEVDRSDRIITQLMGYARLAEGRVEKLDVVEEIEHALNEVFPRAIGYEVELERLFARDLPPLFMQRGHLAAVLVNLLQNAREALGGHGHIKVAAQPAPNFSVEITIHDNGPGISTDQSERVFEAYFTTKDKGTGLGLAIVKHNVDLYGGTIRVDSSLGKGCRFVLVFPSKSLMPSVKNP
jgi:signal transduction histidine kinase